MSLGNAIVFLWSYVFLLRASLIPCDNYLVRDVLLGSVWLIIAVHVAMSLDRVVAAMPSVFL
jgi:hypothetical protein